MKKFLFATSILIFLTVGLAFILHKKQGSAPSPIPVSQKPKITASREKITQIATDLVVPWELVFLPNGNMLFTERIGNLKMISNGKVSQITKISDVKAYGEGGLLGMALSPHFSENHYIFLYYTFSGNNNSTLNRVARYKFENNALSDQKIIIDNIPGAIYHDGGRIKFGPDNYLYITTGDSRTPSLAQNKNSLAGKILRVDENGKAPSDNPFGNLVYSYGHRNPQGLAWDDKGRLWETEHGPSGEFGLCCRDEVNLIVKGHNYGWPTINSTQTKSGMESPIIQSGNDTWAPGGALFYNSALYFGGLKGQTLYKYMENGTLTPLLKDQFGRIRDVVLSPDNYLYILTSNRDGRGTIHTGDDKIIKIDPTQM